MIVEAEHVARRSHPERRGQSRTRVPRPVAIVLAFAPEKKAVQSFVLPDGRKPRTPSGQELVDIALVADVENEFVPRSLEDPVQGNAELDDPEVGPEVAARLGQNPDQFSPDFLGELWKVFFVESLDIIGRLDVGKKRFRIHQHLRKNPPNPRARRRSSR